MKRTIVLAISLLVLVSFAVFAHGGQESTTPAATGTAKVFNVAISLPAANNAWQAKLLKLVQAETAKAPASFKWTIKSATSDADQLNTLQIFENGGYDMIMVLPGNGTLLTPVCQDIYKKGIKLFIIDRPIKGNDYTVYYGGDNPGGGRNAAKYFGERLHGKGQIVILRSYVGTPIDLDRYNGFMSVIKKDYPGIKVLTQGDGEFNREAGFKAMSNILPGYPHIDAVYAQDDEAAIGALNAIQNAKRKDIQFITGFGGTKDAYKLMMDKNPIYGASMSYFPSIGAHAVDLAEKILEGANFKKNNIEPSIVVTQKNVAKYLDEAY